METTMNKMNSQILTNSLQCIIDNLVAKTKEHKGTLYSVAQMKDLAEETGLSYRTVLRQVQEIENLGLGEVASKRGPKGGSIILFNQEKMHEIKPEYKNNPFVEGSPRAEELKEMEFPSWKPERKGLRRTKEEMDKVRLEQHAQDEHMARLNDELERTYKPTVELLEAAYPSISTEATWKAYLLSEAYAMYVRGYSQDLVLSAKKQKDEKKIKQAEKTAGRLEKYQTFPDYRWLGTRRFEDFIRCVELCEAYDIHPLALMTKQFTNRGWAFLNLGKTFYAPFTNMLCSKKALNQMLSDREYVQSKKVGVKNRKNVYKTIPERYAFPIMGTWETLILEINNLFDEPSKNLLEKRMNSVVDHFEKANLTVFDNTINLFYQGRKKGIETSDKLTDREKEIGLHFLKSQITTINPSMSLGANSLFTQFRAQLQSVQNRLNDFRHPLEEDTPEKYEKRKHIYAELGNYRREVLDLSKAEPDKYEKMVERGQNLMERYNNSHYMDMFKTLGTYYGVDYDHFEVADVITKINQDAEGLNIPLDQYGFLDMDAVYKDIMPSVIYENLNQA